MYSGSGRVSDFVDALSAPIQFLSQAEKRAKQLEGLGIDEKDISDVYSLSIVRKKHVESPPSASAAVAADNALQSLGAATAVGRQAAAVQSTASTTSNQSADGDKEKRGATSCSAQRQLRSSSVGCCVRCLHQETVSGSEL